MEAVDEVEIDKEGKFKYILVKVWPATANEEDQGSTYREGNCGGRVSPRHNGKGETLCGFVG